MVFASFYDREKKYSGIRVIFALRIRQTTDDSRNGILALDTVNESCQCYVFPKTRRRISDLVLLGDVLGSKGHLTCIVKLRVVENNWIHNHHYDFLKIALGIT